MPPGRPTVFTPELAASICDKIARGYSLREVCTFDEMPARDTVYSWFSKHLDFSDQYARACQLRAEYWAEEIVEISDDGRNDWVDRQVAPGIVRKMPDPEVVNRSKLRVDTRKWLMSKLQPKKYGDKITQEHTGPDGGPPTFIMNLHIPKV